MSVILAVSCVAIFGVAMVGERVTRRRSAYELPSARKVTCIVRAQCAVVVAVNGMAVSRSTSHIRVPVEA